MSGGRMTKSKIAAVNIQVMLRPVLPLSLAAQIRCRTNYRYNTISSAAVTLPRRFKINPLCSLLCLCTHTPTPPHHTHTHRELSALVSHLLLVFMVSHRRSRPKTSFCSSLVLASVDNLTGML